MDFHVEKSSFLNEYYPDDKNPGDKVTQSENESDEEAKQEEEEGVKDPFEIPIGECSTCLKKLTTEEVLSMVLKCANFAAEKHTRQRRKDAEETPYINHPIGVANILTSEGDVYEAPVILSALLHDTVEDTETTFHEIEREFGKTVGKIVAEVTDDKTLAKAERKRLQIENSKYRSREAKLVTLADKIYNLRDIQSKGPPVGWTDTRVKEYFQWAKKVVDNCRGTNSKLEHKLDIIFAKQCKDTKKNCNCTKRLSPTCSESYLTIL